MGNLKQEYKKIKDKREKVVNQINELKENDIVKLYLDLIRQNDKLLNLENAQYERIKLEEYSSCNHIFIPTYIDREPYEGRKETYYGCIKCGLNQKSLYLMNTYPDADYLSFDEQIMYNYLVNHGYFCHGKYVEDVLCNFELAKSIYLKIKENNPEIDDETALKYFEISLDKIRNKKDSEDQKINRAKRLSLNSKFNKWDKLY